MATTRKLLSRAKSETAEAAIAMVLDGTHHDDRLTEEGRAILENAQDYLHALTSRLRHDERFPNG